MSLLLCCMCLWLSHIEHVTPIEFPNNVVGLPEVRCGENDITLTVNTLQGNPSHMFVVGKHEDPECVTRNHNQISILHESCGVTRERNVQQLSRDLTPSEAFFAGHEFLPVDGQELYPVEETVTARRDNLVALNPPGIMYRVCIAIQLHPQFVTKVDRTFCARCLYTEGVNEYTREINVSPKGSTEIPAEFDAPMCTYTIRRGSPTGPEIKYAQVGEGVFHVWKCPSEMNGMLVQNCYVEDGQGNRILIVDQNGCGVDQYILQTPEYTRDLTMAMQESHVFKFADKTVTRFTCQIKICIKSGDGCLGVTPPQNCAQNPGPDVPGVRFRSKARRRFARSMKDITSGWILKDTDGDIMQVAEATVPPFSRADDFKIDVSEELMVLDDLDEEFSKRLIDNPLLRNRTAAAFEKFKNAFCVSQEAFIAMLVITVGLGLLGFASISVCLYLIARHRRTVPTVSKRSHYHR